MNRVAIGMKLLDVILGAAIPLSGTQHVAAGREANRTQAALASDLRDNTRRTAAAFDNSNWPILPARTQKPL